MFKNKRLIVSKITSNFRDATKIIEEDVAQPGEFSEIFHRLRQIRDRKKSFRIFF